VTTYSITGNDKPYGYFRDWAGKELTVIPLYDRLPISGITWAKAQGRRKIHVWQDDWDHAARHGSNGGGVLLRNDKWNLCVIDVDLPDTDAEINRVRNWLREKLNRFYLVETRTRRGWHIWFKCHTDLKKGKSRYFGESESGEPGLDLLAETGQVPLPGSVYNKKGQRGHYRWAGRFDGAEPTVEEFLEALPYMTQDVWDELRLFGTDGKKTSSLNDHDFEVTDERFAHLHRNPGKQDCPVCGNRTLEVSRKFNGWLCYHSSCKGDGPFKVYKVIAETERQLEVVDAALQGLSERPDDQAKAVAPVEVQKPLSPLQRALRDMEAALPEDRLAVELFPEGDPLADWSQEAFKAAQLAAKMNVYDVPLRCMKRGLGAIVATGKKLIKTETSCWSYACETCGPILRKCLKISLATAMTRRGAEASTVYVFEADYSDPQDFNSKVARRMNAWARKVAKKADDAHDERMKAWGKSCDKVKENLELKWLRHEWWHDMSVPWLPKDDYMVSQVRDGKALFEPEPKRAEVPPFEWCAIQTTPGTAYVMMWGEVSPREIERSSSISGTVGQMVDYVFNRVDQDEWNEHNKKLREEYEESHEGETKHFRTVYMLAPRFMKGLVNDLKNFLTGRNRSGLENGRVLAKRAHEWDRRTVKGVRLKDKADRADFAFLPTYYAEDFVKYAEDKLRTTLKFEVDHATGFGSTQSARLQCKAAPLVREFIAENPHLHAHKKRKLADLALADEELDLYLGE